MHHVAAAEQQDAVIAQRSQPGAEFVVEAGRLRRVDAQLHDRHIGLRIHVMQHRPGAVIEAPGVVGVDRQRRQQLLHALRQGRIAGRRVAHLAA